LDASEDKAITAAAARLGICVTTLDAKLDVTKQLADLNQFIAQKMDAIIIFPLAPNSLNPALNKAHAAGIKLLGLSAIVTDKQPQSVAPYDATYDQNAAVGGAKRLSQLVASRLHRKGNILGIGIGFPVPSLRFMMDNYRKFVTAGNPNLRWLGEVDNRSDDIVGGRTAAAQALTRFHGQKIDAVMAYSNDTAIGAALAFKAAHLPAPILIGQDGNPAGVEAVKSGQITAIGDSVPWRSGLIIANLVNRLLHNQNVPKVSFGRDEIYTKANIAKRLDWDQAIKMIASGKLTCQNGGCPSLTASLKPA
jgi:ribose transport system substrate-binding protein